MWQVRREEPHRNTPPASEQHTETPPVAAGHSSGVATTETSPLAPTQASREKAARLMAHWADPASEQGPAHAGPQNAASDSHFSFGKLWNKAGSALLQTGRDLGHAARQEGWLGALMDPLGALDRQQAQRELRDRFQVVPNQFVGPRLPNQVTNKEYEQIAGTYSDIRIGRGDLTIDTSAYKSQQQRDAYQSGALDDVAALMQTRSGRHEIEQLHNNGLRDETGKERSGIFGIPLPWGLGGQIHHQTTMMPLLKSDGMPDKENGQAIADDKGDTRAILGDGSLGAAGPGTDVRLQYNPRLRVGNEYPELAPSNPWLAEMRSDILLSHEMNHAIQKNQGMVDNRLVRATDNASNRDDPAMALDAKFTNHLGLPLTRVEHQAVGAGIYADMDMTENRYRAERREIANSQGKGQLDGDSTLHQRDAYTPWHSPTKPEAPLLPAQAPTSDIEPQLHRHDTSHGKRGKYDQH